MAPGRHWFGHLIPPGSTILTGNLIQHGDPGDPPTMRPSTATTISRRIRSEPSMQT